MSISSADSSALHIKPVADLNIIAEANRILYVLDKIITRAKLMGILEKCLKEEGRALKDILDSNTFYMVQEACDKYIRSSVDKSRFFDSFSSSEESMNSQATKASDQYAYGDTKGDDYIVASSSSMSSKSQVFRNKFTDRNDNFLSKMIYTLEDNPEMKNLARNMEDDLSPQMKCFVKTLTEFKERMAVQLGESATQYKNKEKYLRDTFEKNEKAKQEIQRLEEELIVTKTDANVCLIGRNILINRHQNKIEKIQKSSAEAIDKRVNESEKAMVNDWKESLIQQERLKLDYNQASDKYSNMLKDHLAIEKTLRAKKSKIENQVLGWIQKYDQDIGEKQAEEEEIQALLDQETKEVNEIRSKLDEQEEEYDDLMQEKVEYEEELLERRLYQFVVNVSARRIQRTFRLYKARKLAKKLAKKGKKGKKKG